MKTLKFFIRHLLFFILVLIKYEIGFSQSNINFDKVFCSVRDVDGTIWLATDKGVNKLDTKTGIFTSYQNKASDPNSLSNDAINITPDGRKIFYNHTNGLNADFVCKIFITADGTKWFLHSGSYVYENSKGQIKTITSANGISYLKKDGTIGKYEYGVNGFPSGMVYGLAEDIDGSIWLPTNSGIVHLKRDNTLEIKNVEDLKLHADEDVIDISIDNKGNKWFITKKEISYIDFKGNIKIMTFNN